MTRATAAAPIAAASTSSTVAFGGIAALVSGAVFLGPYLETRRRSKSLREATASRPPGVEHGGYAELFEAEERRVFRIAALMTGRIDRATAIAEETFARALQQWTRLPADRRVWFVLSTDVKLCLGTSFVRSLDRPVGVTAATETDELTRAARALGVLEPSRRAITILSHAEGMSDEEVAAVMGIEIANVRSELAAALRQLEAVMGTVAA